MQNILIVEDNADISKLIKITLQNAGFNAETALDGEIGADMVEAKRYDLVLLDIMLPKIDGYDLIAYIKNYDIPVIFISAKGDIEDKAKGFHLGAYDYIVKPFELEELVLRVENVLRHYGHSRDTLKAGGVKINILTRTVAKNGETVPLTPKEYDLLVALVRGKNMVLRRYSLYEKVWDEQYSEDTRTLDIHIRRLRKKLQLEKEIKTVPKVGYMLEVDN